MTNENTNDEKVKRQNRLKKELENLKRKLKIKEQAIENLTEQLTNGEEMLNQNVLYQEDLAKKAIERKEKMEKELNEIKDEIKDGKILFLERRYQNEKEAEKKEKEEEKKKAQENPDSEDAVPEPPSPTGCPFEDHSFPEIEVDDSLEDIPDEEILKELDKLRAENMELESKNARIERFNQDQQKRVEKIAKAIQRSPTGDDIKVIEHVPKPPQDEFSISVNKNTHNVVEELKKKFAAIRKARPNYFGGKTIEGTGKGMKKKKKQIRRYF